MRSPSSAGIAPVNWLLKRTSVCRLVRSPSSAVIRPRQLSCQVSCDIVSPGSVRVPRPGGITPSTGCTRATAYSSLVRSPSRAGIGPVSPWFPTTPTVRKLVRSPSAAGIVPVNPLFDEAQPFQIGEVAQPGRDWPRHWLFDSHRDSRLVRRPARPGSAPSTG